MWGSEVSGLSTRGRNCSLFERFVFIVSLCLPRLVIVQVPDYFLYLGFPQD